MSNTPYIISTATLTFYVGGQPYTLDRNSPVFNQVRDALNANAPAEELIRLADSVKQMEEQIVASAPRAVNYLTKGIISVTRSGVLFNDEPLEGPMADRLMDILNAGLRIGPFVRFAENVLMNPAEHAREELMLWLEKADLPITEDGHFLAYKVVRDNYTDVYTGRMDNSVGQVVQLKDRSIVDPNRDNTCSVGLHFCSKDYLPSFGANASGRRIVLVKVNPADVVSIPSDYNNTKGRTWRYEVVDEVDFVTIQGTEWTPVSYDYTDDDFVDDYDDEAYDDEDWYADEDEAYSDDDGYDEEYTRLMDEYGIVQLRKMASNAGLNSTLAYKVYNKSQLASFIASKTVEG